MGYISSIFYFFTSYTDARERTIRRFFKGLTERSNQSRTRARLGDLLQRNIAVINLWTEYRLPRGFEVGGGGNFVGARTANTTTLTSAATPIEKAPEYWTFNAMVKYDISERIALQANINNILDRFYLDELHPGHVIPGAGASALFGMKFKF